MDAPLNWQPLALLREQFKGNLQSLSTRDRDLASKLAGFVPAASYNVAAGENVIAIGRDESSGIVPLPNTIPPAAARQIVLKLFPGGQCTEPVLVAGLDQGWLWNLLYQMDVSTPRTPGHRPPLYFLARSIEQLWIVLHLHDWRKLLGDTRVRLFAGDDGTQRCQQSMIENAIVPWPRLSVTVDPQLWPPQTTIDTLITMAYQAASTRLNHLMRQLNESDASVDREVLARRMKEGSLRVLGITSRFTTFLQYSMRDWLDAFEQLGHHTRLLIEQADEQVANPLYFAEVCNDFKPDLILTIDHYRGEFAGLPKNVPCVMWVQDRMPSIFRPEAGAAQGSMDYVLGYGRQECVLKHGYPRERFMPAMVGFNENRFAKSLSHEQLAPFQCDISFVSHASTPPEVLVQREIEKTPLPEARRFLSDTLEKLRAIYQSGGFVTETGHIRKLLRDSMLEHGVQSSDNTAVVDFFAQKVNNALFRQQALGWLAELDVNLHLYGRGWEQHPRFNKFARGIADNESQLAAICQASTINLQVTPFGAIHQRLLDALAAGGFVLMRHCTGDDCDRIYQQMWHWCEQAEIRSGEQFFRQAPSGVQEMIARITELTGDDPSEIAETFFVGLEEAASAGFTRSPATLFAEYDRVAFKTRSQLQTMVKHFLSAADERHEIAQSMRRRALESMTYRGITQRLLNFIAQDIRVRPAVRLAA